MTEVALIWAQARDAAGRPVIGASGDIPWHVPEDFAHFRSLTSGHPVIMGQRTWESLPLRPLPGRANIVLSLDPGFIALSARRGVVGEAAPDVVVVDGPQAALARAATVPGGETAWVIGGGQVYRTFLELGLADRLEVTEIDAVVAGDTYAPAVTAAWIAVSTTDWATATTGLRYRFRTYLRA
ncbi:MAG: dihydrofolate reductase [Promicromonosporaceae bacterium]|nr:dihydrofolate reductase [Promicromonosporaceae bacterium]